MNRRDGRSVDEFSSHIKFTTEVESRLMAAWAESSNSKCDWYQDNGVDNGGGYVPDGSDTSPVDFIASVSGLETLLELKFAPTRGKITLKTADLKNYIRQWASVLLIINTSETSLRVPKDRDIKKHWKLIVNHLNGNKLRWAIIDPHTLGKMLKDEPEIQIPYMGYKPGIVVPETRYALYFKGKKFLRKS